MAERKVRTTGVAIDAPQSANRELVRRARSGGGTATYNLSESPLAWLVRRGKISLGQFAAGERLRADYELAGKGARVTMNWDADAVRGQGGGAGPTLDPTQTQIAARARFDGAIRAAGAGLSDVLWRTVCNGEGLELTERDMGWPARAGKVVLALALDRVAGFYGV